MNRILVLNFGGTSSKVSIYEDEKCRCTQAIYHKDEEIGDTSSSCDQTALRTRQIQEWMNDIGMSIKDIDAFAVRLGGAFYGGNGGTFLVEGALREQIDSQYILDRPPVHSTRLTMAIVDELQKCLEQKRPSYATDPSSIDQFLPEARITGHPLFTKRASFHALNQRAVARKAASALGKKYEEINVIVAHAGGGVSVGAHEKGRIIDVNDSSGDGNGPFSPNRSGSLPTGQLMHLCFSGKCTEKEVYSMLKYQGGLKAHLGTDDLRVVTQMVADGDEHAKVVFNALAYQISREIGACYATLRGKTNAIIITGGMAHSSELVNEIASRVAGFAPFLCYPGEFENEALALGAYRVITHQEDPAIYRGECGHLQAYSLL